MVYLLKKSVEELGIVQRVELFQHRSSSALIFFREVIVSSIWYALAGSRGLQSVRTHIAEGNKMTKRRTMQFGIQMILL